MVTLVAFFTNMVFHDAAWALTTSPMFTGRDISTSDLKDNLKEFNVETFTLPSFLGMVNDKHNAGEGSKTVIHIQDAHCNYACQMRISGIIDHFAGEYGIRAVNLEGGAGDYDLSIFTRIEDPEIRRKVTDYFVTEGLVNGAEYFAINNPGKIELWGVEDADLYLANLNAYRDSLKYRDEVKRHITAIKHVLNNLKMHMYSPEMLELDMKYTAYKSGNMGFREYLNWLTSAAHKRTIDIKQLSNIFLLNQTMIQEDQIDFRTANRERNEIIDRLHKRLSVAGLEELTLKTFDFRSEKISQKDFYSYLVEVARERRIDLSAFPAFQKYVVYVAIYDAIDKAMIMREMETLENILRDDFCGTSQQHELALLSKHLNLMENLFEVRLTKEDYRYYLQNENAFHTRNFTTFIDKHAPRYNVAARPDRDIDKLDRYREHMGRFYGHSFERDEAFVDNLLFSEDKVSVVSRGANNIGKIAVIVTGGFHTENLTRLFKERGISYVSVMPKFRSSNEQENQYFALLGGDSDSVLGSIQDFTYSTLAIASFLNENINIGLSEGVRRRIAFDILARWRTEKEKYEEGRQEVKDGLAIRNGDNYLVLDWSGDIVFNGISQDFAEKGYSFERFENATVTQFAPELWLPGDVEVHGDTVSTESAGLDLFQEAVHTGESGHRSLSGLFKIRLTENPHIRTMIRMFYVSVAIVLREMRESHGGKHITAFEEGFLNLLKKAKDRRDNILDIIRGHMPERFDQISSGVIERIQQGESVLKEALKEFYVDDAIENDQAHLERNDEGVEKTPVVYEATILRPDYVSDDFLELTNNRGKYFRKMLEDNILEAHEALKVLLGNVATTNKTGIEFSIGLDMIGNDNELCIKVVRGERYVASGTPGTTTVHIHPILSHARKKDDGAKVLSISSLLGTLSPTGFFSVRGIGLVTDVIGSQMIIAGSKATGYFMIYYDILSEGREKVLEYESVFLKGDREGATRMILEKGWGRLYEISLGEYGMVRLAETTPDEMNQRFVDATTCADSVSALKAELGLVLTEDHPGKHFKDEFGACSREILDFLADNDEGRVVSPLKIKAFSKSHPGMDVLGDEGHYYNIDVGFRDRVLGFYAVSLDRPLAEENNGILTREKTARKLLSSNGLSEDMEIVKGEQSVFVIFSHNSPGYERMERVQLESAIRICESLGKMHSLGVVHGNLLTKDGRFGVESVLVENDKGGWVNARFDRLANATIYEPGTHTSVFDTERDSVIEALIDALGFDTEELRSVWREAFIQYYSDKLFAGQPVYQGGALRNIYNAADLTEGEREGLIRTVTERGLVTETVTEFVEISSYPRNIAICSPFDVNYVPYYSGDDIWRTFDRKDIKGGYNISDSRGNVYIFYQADVSYANNSFVLEHEKFESAWKKRLEEDIEENSELQEFLKDDDVGRAAHIMAWASQIGQKGWTDIERSDFIKDQLLSMDDNELRALIREYDDGERVMHKALIDFYLPERIAGFVSQFEKTVRDYAVRLLNEDNPELYRMRLSARVKRGVSRTGFAADIKSLAKEYLSDMDELDPVIAEIIKEEMPRIIDSSEIRLARSELDPELPALKAEGWKNIVWSRHETNDDGEYGVILPEMLVDQMIASGLESCDRWVVSLYLQELLKGLLQSKGMEKEQVNRSLRSFSEKIEKPESKIIPGDIFTTPLERIQSEILGAYYANRPGLGKIGLIVRDVAPDNDGTPNPVTEEVRGLLGYSFGGIWEDKGAYRDKNALEHGGTKSASPFDRNYPSYLRGFVLTGGHLSACIEVALGEVLDFIGSNAETGQDLFEIHIPFGAIYDETTDALPYSREALEQHLLSSLRRRAKEKKNKELIQKYGSEEDLDIFYFEHEPDSIGARPYRVKLLAWKNIDAFNRYDLPPKKWT